MDAEQSGTTSRHDHLGRNRQPGDKQADGHGPCHAPAIQVPNARIVKTTREGHERTRRPALGGGFRVFAGTCSCNQSESFATDRRRWQQGFKPVDHRVDGFQLKLSLGLCRRPAENFDGIRMDSCGPSRSQPFKSFTNHSPALDL